MKRTHKLPARQAVRWTGALRRLWRRMPWYVSPDTIKGRNLRNLYLDTVWFGVLSGLVATYVAVFALRLGATTSQIGWLTALPALVNVVWLIPAARLIERQRRPMPIILATGVLQRLGYLALMMRLWRCDAALPTSMAQIDQATNSHDGRAATRRLAGGLREN